MADVAIRPARAEDAAAVAELLHSTSEDMYQRFAGDRDSSIRLLRAAFGRRGNGASREVVAVAELDGAVAGAMAAFPAAEVEPRGRRFLRLLLWRTPPWTWRRSLELYRLGARVAPPPPEGSYYVDALATAAGQRRRGVASALLAEAERAARERGLPSVALETGAGNTAARALYEARGFEVVARTAPRAGLPGFVAYAKRV